MNTSTAQRAVIPASRAIGDAANRGVRSGKLAIGVTAVLFCGTMAAARIVRLGTTQPAKAAVSSVPATQPGGPSSGPLLWFTKFADALDSSRRTRQPILVDVGADWCVWCRELDGQIATEPVQQRLKQWTLLRLDADRDADAIHNLAVGPLPALRVLAPNGQMLAWHNGYMKADELAAWLDAHAKTAGAGPTAELESVGPPDAAALETIIAQLTDRDPLVHQAAVRRLTEYPDQAAGKIVALFAAGNLRQRLAARELLQSWKAPLQGLDPWNPQSFDPAALDSLKKWAGQKHEPPSLASLSTADVEIARHDIAEMLQTPDPAEVESARERLARFGPALLTEIYASLKSAGTDRDRERLTALRYRCVATQTLALRWPGGFDRLASTDAQARHQALDELGRQVTAADAPLLMELFSDLDPFMRETSLKLLQSSGGGAVPSGLVRLLHDPEPNVRAAVLKQLAETPDPQMVPEVVKYVATEKDIDLVVHAIRFLREAKGDAAMQCLQSLLRHESWRVRAEAAEALGNFVERYDTSSPGAQTIRAAVYSAMVKMLDDPDGFVVSRALGVLKSAQYPEATEPIARVGERRPELAADVVKALGSQNDPAAQAALRKFCSNKDVAVRSAALTGLGTNATAADVLPALNDPASRMRIAAANIVEELLERQRPDSGNSSRNAVGFDWEQWLGDFRSGKGRPEWTNSMAGPLRKMLQSSDARERLVAAVPLAAFGDADAAKVLNEIAVGEPKERREAASAMQWLPWKERLALFELIKSHSAGDSQVLGVLASDLAKSPDPKAGDALWSLLDDRGADLSVASEIDRSLIRAYTGMDYWNWQPDGGGPQRAKALLEAAKQRAAGGSANQRLVALALLLHASSEDAISAAQPLVASPAMGDGLRTAALQVLLLAQPRPAGVKTAVEQLSGPPPLRKVALAYLAAGADPIQTIQGELYLQFNNPTIQFRTFGEGAPIVIEPPPGVTREMIEPLLKDPDGENVAYASYLLCLLGDRQGLDAVVKWWDGNRSEDYWRRLAYRAISVVGDDNLTPTLEQIYATYDKRMGYDIRDFYWTIRVIKGEKVLKLRKRIRDEVGMDQLR